MFGNLIVSWNFLLGPRWGFLIQILLNLTYWKSFMLFLWWSHWVTFPERFTSIYHPSLPLKSLFCSHIYNRLPGEISITSDMQMTLPLMAESEEERKSLLMKVKEESEKKAQHSENEDHGIQPHHFLGNRGGNSGNSVRLHFSGLQNHCRWWLQPWN